MLNFLDLGATEKAIKTMQVIYAHRMVGREHIRFYVRFDGRFDVTRGREQLYSGTVLADAVSAYNTATETGVLPC